MDDLEALVADVRSKVAAAADPDALEAVRIEAVGRKAPLVLALRELGSLPAEVRRARGAELNAARRAIEAAIDQRSAELRGADLERRLRTDRVDVTLPGARRPRGHSHLIEQTRRDILDVFVGFGYEIADGPEIDTVYYNFDALNHTPTHPSRQVTDTFYVSADVVLRTHTSPMQIRTMEAHPPPVYMATAGRCYRRDTPDATHTAMFTQIEGLVVDRGITLAHLKGTLLHFARAIFGEEREVRLRPHFFPFTEPSVEVDVSCFNCARDGSPCRVCRGEGWIEILGAGMVDPNLYSYVEGYDPEEVSGFAFGLGVERVAGLRHDIPDIRLLWENDLRFMEQFG
jgi:phenylalanyl-tRNA synthetase alpha chain